MGLGEFLVGIAIGGLGGGSVGYNTRDAELQPYIASLEQQLRVKDQQLWEKDNQLQVKDQKIAELENLLKGKDTASIPLLGDIRKKQGGSVS